MYAWCDKRKHAGAYWRPKATKDFLIKPHIDTVRSAVGSLLRESTAAQPSMIIRPHNSERAVFLQLDDLDHATLKRVEHISLITVKTSPNGNQAWLAIGPPADRDFNRRVRKATQADLMASGAVHIAGSMNFKRKYESDFPMIEIASCNPGRITSRRDGEAWAVDTAGSACPLSPSCFSPAGRR